MDNRCDPWYEPTIYDTDKLSFKIQDRNPQAQSKATTKFPSTPSLILKRTTLSKTVPVTITSTQIKAENIICIEDKTIWARQAQRQRENDSSPASPPQTAPATAITNNHKETAECPTALPEDLDVIKEFIQHDKDDDYIPSAITLKKTAHALSTS